MGHQFLQTTLLNNLQIFNIKTRNIVALMVLLFFCASAFAQPDTGSAEPVPKKGLAPGYQNPDEESLKFVFYFLRDRSREKNKIDSVWLTLGEDSRSWVFEMTEAAQYESREDLEKRPFYEILTVLGVRLLDRNREIEFIDTTEVLGVLVGKYGIMHRAFALKNLGPFWVEEELGEIYGYRGMGDSPKVPVFFFHWDREFERWNLDLRRMLPIISRGLETIALKQNWSPVKTALFLLENGLDFPVDDSLLDP